MKNRAIYFSNYRLWVFDRIPNEQQNIKSVVSQDMAKLVRNRVVRQTQEFIRRKLENRK